MNFLGTPQLRAGVDVLFLASQDALEVMFSLTDWWLADLTDVTLVSDDT